MEMKQKGSISDIFHGASSDLQCTDPEWVEIITNFSMGEVSATSRLTDRERLLCILAAALGCQGIGEYHHLLHAALNSGLDPVAIKEMLYQATAYLGISRVHDFLVATNEIMKQHNIKLPLTSQGTTNSKNRFEKGLEKQVTLFGDGMAKRQTEGPVLRRNINRWLADNCLPTSPILEIPKKLPGRLLTLPEEHLQKFRGQKNMEICRKKPRLKF
ncbi:MAG: carboxymuconolactone decarboxylase family protein [Ruminococcus sp.]|jgi:4-carboxymuconolactone decarboxylase